MSSNTFSEDFEALQEKQNSLTLEMEILRQRELQWRQEREVLLQRDQWWAAQWQERDRQWFNGFYVRETGCLQAMSERQKPWTNTKDQQLKDCQDALKESEQRVEVLLTLLQQDKHHLVIEIDRSGPEKQQTSQEDESQQTEEGESFWEQAFHAKEKELTEFQLETQRRWDEIKSQHEQEINAFQHAAKEFNAREQFLLNLLKEKRPIVIEIEKAVPEEETQSSGEDCSGFDLDRPESSTKPDDSKALVTFGDLPTEIVELLNSPSVAEVEMVPLSFTDNLSEAAKCSPDPKEETVAAEVEVETTEAPLHEEFDQRVQEEAKTQALLNDIIEQPAQEEATIEAPLYDEVEQPEQEEVTVIVPQLNETSEEPSEKHVDGNNQVTFEEVPTDLDSSNNPSVAEVVVPTETSSSKRRNRKKKAKKQKSQKKALHADANDDPIVDTFVNIPKELEPLNNPSDVEEMVHQSLPETQPDSTVESETPSYDTENTTTAKIEVHDVEKPEEPRDSVSDGNKEEMRPGCNSGPKPTETQSETQKETPDKKITVKDNPGVSKQLELLNTPSVTALPKAQAEAAVPSETPSAKRKNRKMRGKKQEFQKNSPYDEDPLINLFWEIQLGKSPSEEELSKPT